jgi:hypothetical protein
MPSAIATSLAIITGNHAIWRSSWKTRTTTPASTPT